MKIAYYVASWPPGRAANGIVTYTYNLVKALGGMGHETFIITPDLSPERASDIHCYNLSHYKTPNIIDRVTFRLDVERGIFKEASSSIERALVDMLSIHNVDVLEIEESFGWSLPIVERGLLPVVVRLHGPWALYGPIMDPKNSEPSNQRRTEREGRAIGKATYITANCAHTLRSVSEYYKLNIPNNSIIPTPLDPAKNGLWDVASCDRNKLLFVGRFDALKGGDIVLKAFFKLASRRSDLTLTFVGPDKGVTGADGKSRNFEDYMKENFPDWFRSRVNFRGQMQHADVMAIRAEHFATIVAARIDTMGYMLLEPMSLGCPLVTTAVGGIPEFLHDRQNAMLVPSENASAMAEAIQTLLDDPLLADRIGKQAWSDCNTLYSAEVVAKQSLKAYKRAIDIFKN